MELPADLAHQLDETPLHCAVDVFVAVDKPELTALGLGEDAAQPIGDGGGVLVGQDPGLTEHGHMGEGPGDIVDEEPPVGVIHGVPPEHIGGRFGEPPTPERHSLTFPETLLRQSPQS